MKKITIALLGFLVVVILAIAINTILDKEQTLKSDNTYDAKEVQTFLDDTELTKENLKEKKEILLNFNWETISREDKELGKNLIEWLKENQIEDIEFFKIPIELFKELRSDGYNFNLGYLIELFNEDRELFIKALAEVEIDYDKIANEFFNRGVYPSLKDDKEGKIKKDEEQLLLSENLSQKEKDTVKEFYAAVAKCYT